jgi:hypothetical protein
MLKKSVHFLSHTMSKIDDASSGILGRAINIGCGNDIKPFWINCDLESKDKSVKRFDITDLSDLDWLSKQNATLINSDHVIGYLTIAQAQSFFDACFQGLRPGGALCLEFPDLDKLMIGLSKLNYASSNSELDYIEIIRAIYAYDSADAKSLTFSKKTYITGWTIDFLRQKLSAAGFSDIKSYLPRTHGCRILRDSRIEAIK